MDTDYQTIVLGSGDHHAIPPSPGNESQFRVPLANPLDLSRGRYEMCIVNVSFEKPAVLPSSVFVFCDALKRQDLGSNQLPFLFRTRPITAADANPTYIEVTSSILPWKPIEKKLIQDLFIELTDSQGNYLPVGANKTILEVIIRKVSD